MVRGFQANWMPCLEVLIAAKLALRADVAELVDAHGSGPCGLRLVEVQVLSSASLWGTSIRRRNRQVGPPVART
jgi:hypothetical protein